jgi:deoxyribodipyrimidine photo-lyase
MEEKVFFWHRRDLRMRDNAGLFHALQSGYRVQPVFIFDRHILDALPHDDKRVSFLYDSVMQLHAEYLTLGSELQVYYGYPVEIWTKLLSAPSQTNGIYTNEDVEPYALERDHHISEICRANGMAFHAYKDHVIYGKEEVLKDDGKPYTVFTPYSKKWRKRWEECPPKPFQTKGLLSHLTSLKGDVENIPSLKHMGFEKVPYDVSPAVVDTGIVNAYSKNRDYPAIQGTSRLGPHFRFGTLSPRETVIQYYTLNHTWINEFIWRDFYSQILAHFPHVANEAFKREYEAIVWRNDERDFELWKQGKTGVGIVDAGMRELNETGFMHNRVRMIAASYLCKNLLIDWRWGEAYFALKLMDFDLASNNGGWQWASGSGVDAAPYFRIFNPELQTKKFDPDLRYIKRWVPEYSELTYLHQSIIPHTVARDRCLVAYKAALKKPI